MAIHSNKIKLSWGGDPLEIQYSINDGGDELHFHIQYIGLAQIVGSSGKKHELRYRIGSERVLEELPLLYDLTADALFVDVFKDQAMIIKLTDNVSLRNEEGGCRCHQFEVTNSLTDKRISSLDLLVKNASGKIGDEDPELLAMSKKIKEDYQKNALLSINDLISEPLGQDSLQVERLTFSATLGKGLKLLKEPMYKAVTTEDTNFTISLLADGMWVVSRPLLMIDTIPVVPNAYLRSIFFSFKTGKVEEISLRSDKKGLLFFGGSIVKKQVEKAVLNTFGKMMEGTLFDEKNPNNLLPYNPFEDKNFKKNLTELKDKINANLAEGNDAKSPIAMSDVKQFALGGNVVFEKNFTRDLGIAQVLIPADTMITSKAVVKTSLATAIKEPLKTQIERIEINSDGIALGAKGKVQAMFKKIEIQHGGEVRAKEVTIHNEVINNLKLGLVLAKLLLVSAVRRVGHSVILATDAEPKLMNAAQTAALELAFKELLLAAIEQNYALAKSYGIDLKNALGIEAN